MRYNRLGGTGLLVSELCFGTMTFGGVGVFETFGSAGQAEADAMIGHAIEAGINFFDTADVYSAGESERITGQALRNLGVKRSEVVIATKGFGGMGSGPNAGGASRGHLLDAARASLARLQLDYIDLYQVHGFDPATPVEETLRALDDLVRWGDVRYVGVSNWAAWQISRALGVADRRGLERFATVQAYYSLAGRDVEREIVPMAAAENLGLLVWSPLAGGLLSGKYQAGPSGASAGGRRAAMAFPPVDVPRADRVLAALSAIAERRGISVARLAVAWILRQPRVASVLLGARRVEQLADTVQATTIEFDPSELETLDDASRLPVEYPGWMFDAWSQTRANQLAESRI